jgi:hypothetical protein
MRASSTREEMLSLRKTWRRWKATVCTLMNMWSATCWLVSPWETSSDTVDSVPVRLNQPVAGLV